MATFFIQLDQPHYTAGQTVAGEVLMAVPASIGGCQGVSLRLTAFECLKWVAPHRVQPPPPSPIHQAPATVHPVTQPLHHADKIEVSECESEQKSDSGLRPRLVRTANNEFYEVQFHEERRELGSASVRLLQASKLAAGHYAFPFSFKSLEHWPGSLTFSSEQRKAQVRYKLTVAVDPVSPHFDFEGSRDVAICEGGEREAGQFSCQVTSFLCMAKGATAYSLAWTQKAYALNAAADLAISIDNSACTADIKSITLALVQSQSLKNGKPTEEVLLEKEITGVRAGEKRTEEKAIVESIDLSRVKGLLSTSHGKLLSSQVSLTATLHYDAFCFSCSPVSIPLKVYALEPAPELPLVLQKDFKPKKMPASVLSLQSQGKPFETGEKFGA